jgi:hypothetical protein
MLRQNIMPKLPQQTTHFKAHKMHFKVVAVEVRQSATYQTTQHPFYSSQQPNSTPITR